MVLVPTKRFEDAFSINENEDLNIQKELIARWRPTRDVWSLKYGDEIISCASAISAVMINSIFRRKLKLRYHQGSIFTAGFLGLGTAVVSYLNQKTFITNNLLLYQSKCLICNELKSIFLMFSSSVVYPLVAAPTINIAIAGAVGYRIPYLSEVREVIKLWWSIVRPESRTLLLLAVGNIITAGVVTYWQTKSMEKIKYIIIKLDQQMRDEQDVEMATKEVMQVF